MLEQMVTLPFRIFSAVELSSASEINRVRNFTQCPDLILDFTPAVLQ